MFLNMSPAEETSNEAACDTLTDDAKLVERARRTVHRLRAALIAWYPVDGSIGTIPKIAAPADLTHTEMRLAARVLGIDPYRRGFTEHCLSILSTTEARRLFLRQLDALGLVPAVYVDPLQVSSGSAARTFSAGKRFCHLTAADFSPEAAEALHALAANIGLKRAWYQGDSSWPHYDLTPPKRALAVAVGAIEETIREGAYRRREAREILATSSRRDESA
jgi:hypothetical protein